MNWVDIITSSSVSKIELKSAIEALPEDGYIELRRWFSEKDWQKWNQQIEADSKSEKLAFLVKEAYDQKKKGRLKDL